MELPRRDFLKLAAASAAMLGAPPAVAERRNGMPYRTLGKTGEAVSLLCIGGSHIGHNVLSDDEAVRLMRTAVDEGVNFFDNAYIYHAGRSERRMGQAMRDGYRDRVFVMTKHYHPKRTPDYARRQLEASLERLETDVIDLWQIHQIHKDDDPSLCYANDLMAEMEKARDEGKVRYLGFTGHTRPEWHLEMLDGGYAWDTVQMPLNPADHHWNSFQMQVLPRLREQNIGVIAMKTLGGTPGHLAQSGALSAADCMRYVMNLPIASVVSGMDTMAHLRANLAIAKAFEPLAEAEVADILARAAGIAEGGQYEPYKDKLNA